MSQLQRKMKESTHRRIIEAAIQEFSQKGYEGARMDVIAREASVNKATIYYHIGNKQILYATVLHEVFGENVQSLKAYIHEQKSPEDNLRAYIRAFSQKIEAHPYIPRIMMRELATGGKNLPEVVIRDFAETFGVLTGIIDQGVKQGVFIETFPILIHFLAIGPLAFFSRIKDIVLQYADVFSEELHVNFNNPEKLVEEVESLVLNAIRKKNG